MKTFQTRHGLLFLYYEISIKLLKKKLLKKILYFLTGSSKTREFEIESVHRIKNTNNILLQE